MTIECSQSVHSIVSTLHQNARCEPDGCGKRGAKIAAGLPKIEHMCYTLESNSTFTIRGRSVN